MSDDNINWDEEFADDPEWQAMSPEQRNKLLSIMEKMIDMGMAAVYGEEDQDVADADIDCAQCVSHCKAKCCTLIFALTKDEVAQGKIQYNKERPYFIARDEDGYCPHMDRKTFACMIWEDRPLRCRRYDCRDDENIWPDGVPDEIIAAFS
jgi:hypothetical protein